MELISDYDERQIHKIRKLISDLRKQGKAAVVRDIINSAVFILNYFYFLIILNSFISLFSKYMF